MMLRAVIACCLLAVFPAPKASGSGINLSWNDCGVVGTGNTSFACNSNSGSNVLVASFDAPDGITMLVASSAVIDIQTISTLPSWWQLSAGACRAGSLSLDLSPSATFSCVDYWSAAATGSFAYHAGYGGELDRARIMISFGIPEALAGPVETGSEYYAFRLIIDNSKSIGTEICAGCLDPACIILTALWLYQPAGLGDHAVCNPRDRNYVSWQGGAFAPGCPAVDQPSTFPADCLATPSARRSWGLIKGLYR